MSADVGGYSFEQLKSALSVSGLTTDVGDIVSALLERARVVGVLDAWTERNPHGGPFATGPNVDAPPSLGAFVCSNGEGAAFYGPSYDAARGAAAKAVEAGEVGR